MDRDEFWQVIEDSRRGSDLDAQIESLSERLASLAPSDIVDFERHLWTLMAESYTWELWGAAYLIHGGCSDDGFDYFRGWLMAQGRRWFEIALADPDSLADLPELDENVELEDIWYIANQAHEGMAGSRIPQEIYRGIPRRELGEGWDFDDEGEMKRRYPKLSAMFRA
jgi:hypothetical protein